MSFSGINIQTQWTSLILSGEKTLEIRKYPVSQNILNRPLVLIETPGKTGKFKARGVALIKFTSCSLYKSFESFNSDETLHRIFSMEDKLNYFKEGHTWAWKFTLLQIFPESIPIKSIGLVFRKNIRVPRKILMPKKDF